MLDWAVNISIILLISCFEIGAYNLDTKRAVVFSDPNEKFNSRESYFGFSVALYANPSDPVVIVGAPRANVSRLLGIREPGAVYYCRLSGYCKEWPLDNSRNGGLHNIEGINQMLDESWIGATVSVENKLQPRVVVCAPRWKNVRQGTNNWAEQNNYYQKMNGICYYTIAKSVNDFEKPVSKFITDLTDPTKQSRWIFEVATMGFSLHEFSDQSAWNIMIGAPGCWGWSGVPLLVSENRLGEWSTSIPRARPYWYTYRGYSVTSGFYFDDKRRWYVASAPQVDEMFGKIEIFQYGKQNNFLQEVKVVMGMQYGEYFGASVTSCDVDNDGRDDLIVGAPSWTLNEDEGRIYIISARRNSNGFDTTSINGKFEGARFGSIVVCLGDLDHDGYGDVAVGAPYEDKSGAVYIFNGGRYGLSREPSQKILGRDFGGLSGFGMAISEPRDVDGNGYPDVAVGAHKSGHAVLFQAQPVVRVNISLNYVDSVRLNSNTPKFSIRFCGYYDGYRTPQHLWVKKTFRVDEAHHRARLDTQPTPNGTYELEGILQYGKNTCDDVEVHLKEESKTYPIVISTSLILMNDTVTIRPEGSIIMHTVSLNFALDCGPDDICHSNLTTNISTSLGKGNKYVLGGAKTVNISIELRNHQEPAYDTRLHIFLPEFLSLARKPVKCDEHFLPNGSVEVIWNVENPLRHQATLTLEISMRQIQAESELYSDSIEIPIRLTTQSENINEKKEIDSVIINIAIDATVDIKGQAKEPSYSYFSASEEKKIDVIHFDHIYGVQKLGITPIQQAVLIVLVPTHLRKSENEIIEIAKINATTLTFFDSTNRNNNDYICKIEKVGVKEKKMLTGQLSNFTKSVDASLRNRALFLNCDSEAIDCVNVTCLMDVPKESVNPSVIAELKLTIDLLLRDIPNDFKTSKDIIYFVSNGSVMITHPSRASGPSGMRAKSTFVGTKFLGTPVAAPVASWVIPVSVLVGILLLALVIFALIKLGFFKRKHKEELEELKADSDKGGMVIETSSSRECLDQD
ncbi:integrin alpha-8-like isoform X2 [Diachasmimorpha longicaudata]|uniref:integrin alpha-8-like isoform X2 n=1 Tax=Diachasmimorpha longicaudata TaxID=58733 RepID=UPI0030B8D84F